MKQRKGETREQYLARDREAARRKYARQRAEHMATCPLSHPHPHSRKLSDEERRHRKAERDRARRALTHDARVAVWQANMAAYHQRRHETRARRLAALAQARIATQAQRQAEREAARPRMEEERARRRRAYYLANRDRKHAVERNRVDRVLVAGVKDPDLVEVLLMWRQLNRTLAARTRRGRPRSPSKTTLG